MRDVAPPARPWVGRMRWCDLAFLHWPVAPDVVRPLVPSELRIDTYDGQAWVGVVPFRMDGVRLRGVPPIPTTYAFPEINVRTYVRGGARAGVWFFSLDATSRLAVRGARLLYNLPYYDAEIAITPGADVVHYDSRRVHRDAPNAEFRGHYRAISDVYQAMPGTLDHFLVERYCMFISDERRGLGVLDIDHPPWPLQHGTADIARNTMAQAAGIVLPRGKPIVHFARALEVHAWTRTSLSDL